MNELNTDQLFEIVRTAPTELSKDQVAGFIQTIPTLPGGGSGGSWFQNFNLNSIIMTTAVTIVGSALLYFLTSNPQTEIPTPEPSTTEIAVVKADSAIEEKKAEESVVQPKQEEIPEIAEPLAKEPKQTPVEANEPVVQAKPAKVQATLPIPIEAKTETLEAIPPSKEAIATNPEPLRTSPRISEADPTPSPETYDSNAPKALSISDLRLRRLKKTLLRELSKDDLIKNKQTLNIVEYLESEIFVNNNRLTYEQFDKYSELLERYDIEPSDDFRVALAPKFIMAGEFTDKGFKGSALGRDMNINFIESEALKNGLLSGSSSLPKGIGSGLLTHVKEPKDDGRSDEGDIVPNPLISLSSKEIKSLKTVLYQSLVKDDLIDSKKDAVRMLIDKSALNVNGEILNEKLTSKYESLLKKHKLSRLENHKILMSRDFIFVGRFDQEKFFGSVNGKMDSESVMGTILEDDLMKLSFFNDGNHIHTENSILINGKYTTNEKGNDTSLEFNTEERDIAPFHSMTIKGVAAVYYTPGAHKKAQLKVTGMPMRDVITRVVDSVLVVDTRGNPQGESIEIGVSSPHLRNIEVGGAAELYTNGPIKSYGLRITMTDASAAFLELDVRSVNVYLDGGDLELSGKTRYYGATRTRNSERGTFSEKNLKVIWKDADPEIDAAIANSLPTLKDELLSTLLSDKLINSDEEEITISFTKNSLDVNGNLIPENRMNEYRGILAKSEIFLRNDRKLFIEKPAILLVDRNQGIFHYRGHVDEGHLNIIAQDSWKKVAKDFFGNR